MTMTGEPPKPASRDGPQNKSELTREKILTAAARHFRYDGYSAATMRRIATIAKVEAGSIYYHFTTKEEILGEVLERGLRRLYEQAQQVLTEAREQNKDFRQVLSELVDTHLTFLLSESDFTSANIRNYPTLPDELRRRHRPLRRAYSELWNDFLTEAQKNGAVRSDIAIRPVRQFVLGALNWTVEWFDTRRHPVSALSEWVTKLLLDGMAADGHRPEYLPCPVPNPPTPDRKTNKAARTRQQVLSAAARIIRDRGYKAATMRAISTEAGIEAGSIYYHFGSKGEILDEVLDRGLRELLQEVSRIASDRQRYPDSAERLAAAIATHMECLFQVSEFTSANIRIYGQLPSDVRARHAPVRHEYARLWEEILRDAQDSGTLSGDILITPLRQVMLGALNWTVEWFDPAKAEVEGNFSLAELIEMLQQLLFGGLSETSAVSGAQGRQSQSHD